MFMKSPRKIYGLLLIVVFFKLLSYFSLKIFLSNGLFGGGSDADYYNAYTLGYTNNAVNIWPVLLRCLNSLGLYSREFISFLLFLLSIILLPYVYFKLVYDKSECKGLIKSSSYLLVAVYPTIFFFTLDIYRDVFMFFVFILSLFFYKNSYSKYLLIKVFYFILFCFLSIFLFYMRPYLGASLLVTPFVYVVFLKTRRYIKSWIFLYFSMLLGAYLSGALNPILIYRGADGFTGGGSSLGIGLSGVNPLMFLFYFLYSFFAQLFGFYLTSIYAVIVFLIESVPFILAFSYVIKNILYAKKFVAFLLVFFVIYTTFWVLGNDNLGTAVRLRVPSYLSIFACMFLIFQEKLKYNLKH